MRREPILRYEHETLKLGEDGFEKHQLNLLRSFIGSRGDDFNYYSLINNGVKFKQFVGVLSVGGLQIEVLPKADKYADDDKSVWKSRLIEMLSTVYKLRVDAPSLAKQEIIHKSSILDVFIQRFLDEVERLMYIGLVKSYRRVEGNLTALKGKLLISKQVTRNLVHKERFYVSYSTYDRNHLFNRILYKALRIVPYVTGSSYIRNRANTLLFDFPELEDIAVDESLFHRIVFDRKTEDYRISIELAKLLLLNYTPNLNSNSHERVLALMFDMNKLWEEFVFQALRRNMPKYRIIAQNTKDFWTSVSVGDKTVRPDIVIYSGDKCVAVLDTKWKCPSDSKPSDGDLKQMFVYHYYWNTAKTILLYPGSREMSVDGNFVKEVDKEMSADRILHCSMLYLPFEEKMEESTKAWVRMVSGKILE